MKVEAEQKELTINISLNEVEAKILMCIIGQLNAPEIHELVQESIKFYNISFAELKPMCPTTLMETLNRPLYNELSRILKPD